jgi:5-carboxymethyl-2-hydroxymuconate isomerase
MPHIIIEHNTEANSELDLNNISKSLHFGLAEFPTIKLSAIKTRTHEVKNVFIGEESTPNKFIHITLLLLEGRSSELKEEIIKGLFNIASRQVSNQDYTITVETRDLGTYFKL